MIPQDNLKARYKDYALFLPALSSFYSFQICKYGKKIQAHRIPQAMQNGIEGLNFLDADKSYFYYPWCLYSAGHAILEVRPEEKEEMVRNRDPNAFVLGDSGGFQIFSLPSARRMNEDGALFQSYVDGKTHLLSPEKSIEMQRAIGSDIMMVLDQCITSTAAHAEAVAAMELTHRWAVRSLEARGDSPQAMFGIVQGACFHDLRNRRDRKSTRLNSSH